MDRRTLALILVIMSLSGCSEDPPAADTAAAPAPTPGPPPITSREAAPPAAGMPSAVLEGSEVAAPGATFTLPASWQQEVPSSSMRLAQAQIPGAGGPGQLTVFFFGVGGGGGVEGNLQRWVGQVEVAAGSSPVREVFTAGDYRVTWVEVAGTLKAGTMGGPTTAQPDSLLLGAVVEGAGGPWYFKATGPAATLGAERETFLAVLRSVRAQ